MLDPRFHTRYMVPEEIQVIKARAVCEMESCQPEPELVESETRPQASGSAEDTPGLSDAKRPKKTLGSEQQQLTRQEESGVCQERSFRLS